ncbi:MAG: hypothetical protein GY765_07320 [bacterium]|nr:hypothetical protein [bacterium]
MSNEIDFIFLEKAVEENIRIILHPTGTTLKATEYYSRFLAISLKDNCLSIDIPSGKDKKKKIPPDLTGIAVTFFFSGFRYHFDSSVLRRSRHQLNDEVTVPVLKIALPSKLLDANRRSAFRVPVPINKPVKVFYLVLHKGASLLVDVKMDLSRFFQAVMIDISGGGLAIKSDSDIRVTEEKKLMLWFKLEDGQREYIRMEGLLRNIRQCKADETQMWGIEFIPKKDVNFNRSLKQILKYVMNKQRAMIAKK